MLKIYIDFKSPASYLAFKPACALIKKHNIDVSWLPFITKQESLREYLPNESAGDSHRRVRAQARRDIHTLYAQLQSTVLKFPAETGVTDLALSVIPLLDKNPESFIQAAFNAYWVDNQNLNDSQVVSSLLQHSGNNSFALNEVECLENLATIQQNSENEKIVDAPAFVVDEQIFIGREHLPWIESIVLEKSATKT